MSLKQTYSVAGNKLWQYLTKCNFDRSRDYSLTVWIQFPHTSMEDFEEISHWVVQSWHSLLKSKWVYIWSWVYMCIKVGKQYRCTVAYQTGNVPSVCILHWHWLHCCSSGHTNTLYSMFRHNKPPVGPPGLTVPSQVLHPRLHRLVERFSIQLTIWYNHYSS